MWKVNWRGKWASLGLTGGVLLAYGSSPMAAFTAIASQEVDNLMGVDTAGAETGIYEIVSNVSAGLQVAAGVVVAFVGYALIRTLIMKARGR